MKGYRTITLNVLATVVGALMTTDWGSVADAHTAGVVVGGLGLANTVLRFFTDGPIGGGREA
ncbi:MAG: hypothetical protein LWW93_01985 [Hyphomicrobiales bacterium]|nr:hypothetical protein [Hyphomicrobiales bacterium]